MNVQKVPAEFTPAKTQDTVSNETLKSLNTKLSIL